MESYFVNMHITQKRLSLWIIATHSHTVTAPIAASLAGNKKLLGAIFPSAPLAPFTRSTSTLLNALSVHVILELHELPLSVCLPSIVTCALFVVLFLLLAARLSLRVEVEDCNLKPTSPFLYAVLRSRVKEPVCELSVNPLAALAKAMQFVML